MKVAKSISELRLRLGMNQAEFAKAIGVSQGSVSKWESGREKPRIDALESIKNLSLQIETQLELETPPFPTRVEKMRKVPLVGSIAGFFERAEWGPEDQEYLVLPFPAEWEHADLEARIVERSTVPEFQHGTIVISAAYRGGDELSYLIQGLAHEETVVVKTTHRNEGTSFSIWEFVVDSRKKQGSIWPIEKGRREWPQLVDENGITEDGKSQIVGIIVAKFHYTRSRVDFAPLPEL